jgi:transposase, IS30 family
MVGINPRTGKRWRHGRTITSGSGRRLHYPPVISSPVREVSPRFLSEDERVAIADLHRRGRGVRAIAREVGRDPATISRELRRNLDPASGQYRPFAAQRMAAARRARPGRGKLAGDAELAGFVAQQLRRRWSPEQICQALRERFPDQPSRHLVPETIYQALYRSGSRLCRELPPRVLRTGRSRRRPRRHPNARRGRLGNMTMIDKRPAEVAERSTPGHWEGDRATRKSHVRSGDTDWRLIDEGVTRSSVEGPSPPLACVMGDRGVRSPGESRSHSRSIRDGGQGEDRTGERE